MLLQNGTKAKVIRVLLMVLPVLLEVFTDLLEALLAETEK